jgi:hypothetical protein
VRMLLTAVLALCLAPVPGRAGDGGGQPASTSDAPGEPVARATVSEGSFYAPGELPPSSRRFRIRVTLDHSIGSGTFVAGRYAYVAAKIGISPRYSFELKGVKLRASARISSSFEYTPPDNTAGRRFSWEDIDLELSAPAFFVDEKLTGISFSANVGATLPISLQSRWANVITGLSGRVSASRAIGKFTVTGRFGASKTLYSSYDIRLSDSQAGSRDAQDHALYLCRSNPNGCLLAASPVTERVPPLWSMSGVLIGDYVPVDKLSFSIGWGLGKTYKVPVGVDDLSTRAVYSDGTAVADAQGQSDRMIGTFGASYRLTEVISVSFEVGTIQPPRTADGKAFRFPFFAFRNIEDSFTSYSLAFSGTY